MLCFSDNDIILKLAACNLLDEAFLALGCSQKDIRVLPTAIYKLKNRNTKLIEIYGQEGVNRAIAFVSSVPAITEHSDSEQALLNEVDDLDSGEAILFAATYQENDFILTTGDKRSLRALTKSVACKGICKRLNRRVICFEQILLKILDNTAFELVKMRVLPAVKCDTVLSVVFGMGDETALTNARQTLNHYIDVLRKDKDVDALLTEDKSEQVI